MTEAMSESCSRKLANNRSVWAVVTALSSLLAAANVVGSEGSEPNLADNPGFELQDELKRLIVRVYETEL